MAIIAGIDEAGFGPLLGPLVVSAAAFSVPDEHAEACMWKLLSPTVGRKVSKRRPCLAIGDSKKLYSGLRGTTGLANLERGVLAMLNTSGVAPRKLAELLAAVSPAAGGHRGRYAWYSHGDLDLPHGVTPMDLSLISNALSVAMAKAGVCLEAMKSEVVFEGEFNRIVAATRNKSTTLYDITCRLLAHLWQQFAGRGLRIHVDHQGGRVHYLPTLERVFEGCRFVILQETEDYSAYRIADGERWAEICFRVQGEKAALPVALASMVSKYIRELLMELFNQFWARESPGIVPTAGYYVDGNRFLAEIAPAAKRLGIDEAMICRSR